MRSRTDLNNNKILLLPLRTFCNRPVYYFLYYDVATDTIGMWQGTDQIRYWYCDTAMGIDANAMSSYVEKTLSFIKDHKYEFISTAGVPRDVHNPKLQASAPSPLETVLLSDKNWTAIEGVRDLAHLVIETPSMQRRSQSTNVDEDKTNKNKATASASSDKKSSASSASTSNNNTSSTRMTKRNYSNNKSLKSADNYSNRYEDLSTDNYFTDYHDSHHPNNENRDINIEVNKNSGSSNYSSLSSRNSSIPSSSYTATTRPFNDEDLAKRVAEINRLTALALDERLTVIQDSIQLSKVKEESLLLAHKDDLLKLTEQKILLERQREETAVEMMRRHKEESEKDLRQYYEFVRKEQRDYRRMIYEEDRYEAKKKRRHDRVDRIAEDMADRNEQEARESRAYFERLQIRQYRHELDREESFRKTSSSRTNNHISTGVNLGKLEGTRNFCGDKDTSTNDYHKMMIEVAKDNYINDNRILASHIKLLPSSAVSENMKRNKHYKKRERHDRVTSRCRSSKKSKKEKYYYSSSGSSCDSSSESSEHSSSEDSVEDIYYEENKALKEEYYRRMKEDNKKNEIENPIQRKN